ncbi:hypothetical protein GGTG_02000 [Gaeumannomyces tritici R3-111a-1]|uniref:Uncharacterized protein n=1 Tax=Gaeumannomyces tritici (strain R3-111a-1) TaxID=644352 RepID=J3NL59_GAET3|nr:hypothetical protein GGTG_02000 [Gaeumannomyces tritici R3-111a-1]EJT82026.1 hypothetical protein GGTG_02000 [Gaeumannomyces tritici R3-111a-1]
MHFDPERVGADDEDVIYTRPARGRFDPERAGADDEDVIYTIPAERAGADDEDHRPVTHMRTARRHLSLERLRVFFDPLARVSTSVQNNVEAKAEADY